MIFDMLRNKKIPTEFRPRPPKEKFEAHGGPADRGSADAYYFRAADPHWYPNGAGNAPRVPLAPNTPEYRAYMNAYNNEDDRKEW